MGALSVNDHDGYIMCERRLGWWVECECSWISNSKTTEAGAWAAHARHAGTDAS